MLRLLRSARHRPRSSRHLPSCVTVRATRWATARPLRLINLARRLVATITTPQPRPLSSAPHPHRLCTHLPALASPQEVPHHPCTMLARHSTRHLPHQTHTTLPQVRHSRGRPHRHRLRAQGPTRQRLRRSRLDLLGGTTAVEAKTHTHRLLQAMIRRSCNPPFHL